MVSPIELNYFIEVAHSLNLSRAAERIGISQPSLSTAIKRLETSIGTTLLIRHKKGVSLTQAGKQLLAHSKQLTNYWEQVKAQALASHANVQGMFNLGCHPSVALHYLPDFLPDLLIKHSKLNLKLVHDISRKITEQVINLTLDLAIVVNPVKHPDLIIQKLIEDEVTFWQTAQQKNPNQDIQSGSAVLICDTDLTQTQWLLKQAAQKNIKYERMLTSTNLEVVAQLTAYGCGIGILPSSIALSAKQKLVPIAKAPVYKDEICLIYRHENRHVKAMQVMINAIKKQFQQKTNSTGIKQYA